MRLGVPKETHAGERRVAATPETTAKLVELGFEVRIETQAGAAAGFPDASYVEQGAQIVDDAWADAQVVLKVRRPNTDEAERLPEGAALISLVQPGNCPDLLDRLNGRRATLLALDCVPRITRAQKMDVLSSMANISGYRAVVEASNAYAGFFGMQVTAAGKTPPATVLVIGAGVAGLAALGAARGMGAKVFAFDVRDAAREQVESMGATLLQVELEESGDGGGGYAKVMSKEFIDAEMALFREYAPQVDVVITTALIPGRKAPILWTADMVELMKPGSVVVDLAAENGGNCELTEPGEKVTVHGVQILGYTDLASRQAEVASMFFARNLLALVEELGGAEGWNVDHDDEAIRGALVLEDGETLWPPPRVERKPPPEPEAAPEPLATKEPEAVEAAPEPKKKDPNALGRWIGAVVFTSIFVAVGVWAPSDFVRHFTVFVLSCFAGWQLIWNVNHALHTPLMSVTNAISGIILVGGMLHAGQSNHPEMLAVWLGVAAILVATINVVGGFVVTHRMLQMFRRS
jgi:NAD(P) transhydrogenase subunit alpha